VGLSLRNLRLKTRGVTATGEEGVTPDGHEEITEAMAERLAERTPRLIKGTEALKKASEGSPHHRMALQKWVDKESAELLDLRETVIQRKRSYLETASHNTRISLAARHPVWMSSFNISLDQIKDLFAVSEDKNVIVHCLLEVQVLQSVRIFYYGSGSDVLSLDSRPNMEHDCTTIPAGQIITREQGNGQDCHRGEYYFRPISGGHAQWTFTGNRWGIANNSLWIDFGKDTGDCIVLT